MTLLDFFIEHAWPLLVAGGLFAVAGGIFIYLARSIDRGN